MPMFAPRFSDRAVPFGVPSFPIPLARLRAGRFFMKHLLLPALLALGTRAALAQTAPTTAPALAVPPSAAPAPTW